MKNICTNGFKCSGADKKALEYYLLDTPKEWAKKSLDGMINKAVKTIMKDWIETLKKNSGDSIPATKSEIITAITVMEEFKHYYNEATEKGKAEREEAATIEIWSGGFNIEDYEFEALGVFYKDPEQTLRDFMENKITLRKKAFVKEHQTQLINDPSVSSIPSKQDSLINLVTGKPGYKNRTQKKSI